MLNVMTLYYNALVFASELMVVTEVVEGTYSNYL